MSIFAVLFGAAPKKEGEGDQVTLGQIEDRLRSLTSGARDAVMSTKRNSIAAGILGGFGAIVGAYLHGRRRGRRRASVLEIERQ